MTTETPERKLRDTIPEVKLGRMESDLWRLRRNPVDGPMLSRFGYDHSNTTVYDTNGKCDLLIPNSVPLAHDIARLLQHVSPAIMGELVRGYRLARAAGLLGDGRYSPAAAQAMSTAVGKWEPHEHEANGAKKLAELAEVIRRADRQPGGIKLNDPPGKKAAT